MGGLTRAVRGAVAAVLLLCSVADAVYIKMKQGEQKCFIEELHKDEIVIIHYKSPDQSPLPQQTEQEKYHVGLKLEVWQGTNNVFEGRTDAAGRFAFTALQGEHHLCWTVAGQSLGQDFRIHMDVKVGLEDVDYEKVAKKDHLSAMELKVRKLRDEVARIRSEQSYLRTREERSQKTSDSTFFRVFWFSLFQIVGMAVITVVNLYYLRNYFISKKVV